MIEAKTWHENDDFWETVAPFMFGEQSWAAAPTEVDQVTALPGIQPGATVLDLGCGPGRHSLELAR
jgi:cyclopropane fatty-acyl-phospholipid synthase-like methyltransferase